MPTSSTLVHMFKAMFHYTIKWAVLCLVIGIMAGTTSAGFLVSLDWVTSFREMHKWIILFLPMSGLLIGWLYHRYGQQVQAGNQILFAQIAEPGNIIPFRMAPMVYVCTLLTHVFGGSAGREGTALQMSGALADQLSRPFRLSKDDRRILLITGVAAGFGAVFGTPFAGVIFALEVIRQGSLPYKAILPAFAAALISDSVTNLWHVTHLHYTIPSIPSFNWINLGYAAIAGILFGCCARLFTLSLEGAGKLFSTLKYAPFRPFIGGVVIVIAIWVIGTTDFIGLGIPVILRSFETPLPPFDFLLKIAFTAITLGAGFKGGEVTPLFLIGALLGNGIAFIIPLPIALLAGMGFVAVFSGATHTPIACSIMAIELFGYACFPFVLVACLLAFYVSDDKGIYERKHQQHFLLPKRFL